MVCEVDRFASASAHVLPLWNSRNHDIGNHGVDAFSQDWYATVSFAHPHTNELQALADFLKKQVLSMRASDVVVLAPYWCNQSWRAKFAAIATATGGDIMRVSVSQLSFVGGEEEAFTPIWREMELFFYTGILGGKKDPRLRACKL